MVAPVGFRSVEANPPGLIRLRAGRGMHCSGHPQPLGAGEWADPGPKRDPPFGAVGGERPGSDYRLHAVYELDPVGERRQVADDGEQLVGGRHGLGSEHLLHRPSVPGILSTVTLAARTIRIDHLPAEARSDLDPFRVGIRSGLMWKGNGRTVAGIGEVLRIPIERPGGFATAQRRLAGEVGEDVEPGAAAVPGTGPVAFGALDFDPTSDGELIVPAHVLCRTPTGELWLTALDPAAARSQATDDAMIAAALEGLPRFEPGPEPTTMTLQAALTPELWRDEVVGRARALIRSGELDKCVLARELVVHADAPFDQATLMARLDQTFPTANLFLVDGFFGASPELLVSRLGDVVRAHPLAGTLPRSTDPDRDRTLAAELLASDKNRWEHRITIDWLLDTLLPFCSYVDAEPEPSIVSLANVHHLGTRVEGRLSSPAASVLELVDALHPTPAVGGDPQKAALDLIGEIEQADRGRYAGPAGWVDGNGNGEFAVSVRSAQFVDPDRVRLFAGVGVVADSDLQAELDETRAKFKAILGALVQP